MAAPTKKRAVEALIEKTAIKYDDDDDENDEGTAECEEDECQEYVNQEIQVEFEGRNIEDSDFHGIRKLLSQLFLKANVDLSGLTNVLISQNYVGSVIKQVEFDEESSDDAMDIDDDDSGQVFGIISVINITEKKDMKWVSDMKSLLLERCSQCKNKEKLSAVLHDDNNSLGFIVNERFINIPPQISLPSFQSLWKEIERAKQKKMKYDFTRYIMISKACHLSVKGQGQKDIRSFLNAEEEYFYQLADFSCEYSVKNERDSVASGAWDEDDDEMEPIRVVMVIDASKITEVMERLKETYS